MYFLLIDDHPLMIEAAEKVLSAVFPASKFKRFLSWAEVIQASHDEYDVVVSDLSMPEVSQFEVVTGLENLFPYSRLVFLSGAVEGQELVEFIKSRGHLFLDKGFKPTQLTHSLLDYLKVLERQNSISQVSDDTYSGSILGSLSKRQVEVMELACEGKTINETAVSLGISKNTASSHLRTVFEKLGASNRAHAVSLYIKSKSLASAFDGWSD